MWVGGQCQTLAALPLGKRPGTHHTGGCVGPRASMGVCGKSPPPLQFDSQTVQPIESHYTDCAVPANLRPHLQALFLFIRAFVKGELLFCSGEPNI